MQITRHESIFVNSKKLPKLPKKPGFKLSLNGTLTDFNGCAITQCSFKKVNNIENDVIFMTATCVSSNLTCDDIPYANGIIFALNVNIADYIYFTQTNELISLIKPYNGDTEIIFSFVDSNGKPIDFDIDCDFLFHLVKVENIKNTFTQTVEKLLNNIKQTNKIVALSMLDEEYFTNDDIER